MPSAAGRTLGSFDRAQLTIRPLGAASLRERMPQDPWARHRSRVVTTLGPIMWGHHRQPARWCCTPTSRGSPKPSVRRLTLFDSCDTPSTVFSLTQGAASSTRSNLERGARQINNLKGHAPCPVIRLDRLLVLVAAKPRPTQSSFTMAVRTKRNARTTLWGNDVLVFSRIFRKSDPRAIFIRIVGVRLTNLTRNFFLSPS